MDDPWFVGDHYLHVQAWEADFHPHMAKISTTAVRIRLEQLPIEYYHPEFLKHVDNKLGKLLKIDAVTSAAMRGRFTRLCVQVNTAYPLPKRVKIRAFWQDIIYENLPMLCYQCGHLGHRESHCTEPNLELNDTGMIGANLHGDPGLQEPMQNHTRGKLYRPDVPDHVDTNLKPLNVANPSYAMTPHRLPNLIAPLHKTSRCCKTNQLGR